MHITQSQKSGKHSISNLTDSDLIMLHQSLLNKGYDAQKLADKIEQHLIDCQDEDKILDEYGYSVEEYVRRILDPKCPNLSDDEDGYSQDDTALTETTDINDNATDEVPKLTAKVEIDRKDLVIKGHHDSGGHQSIQIKLSEIAVDDIDSLIFQLQLIKRHLT